MAYGGISQKIQVLEESTYGDGGVTGEVVFGNTQSFEWRTETSTGQTYTLESGSANPTFNIDGVVSVSGTHEWYMTNGNEFKAILGTKTGTTNYTLTVANALPSYSVKVADGDSFRIIKGIKYTKFNLTVARGDQAVTVKAEWIGKSVEDTTTFTPTLPTVEPLTFMDGYVKYGATAQTDMDSFSVDISRALAPRRFLESTAAGSRRYISAIVEGVLSIAFNGVQGAKTGLMQEIYGGATVADNRTDKTYSLILARTGVAQFTLAISGRNVSLGRTMKKDDEIALGEFSGLGLTVVGTGTYPN